MKEAAIPSWEITPSQSTHAVKIPVRKSVLVWWSMLPVGFALVMTFPAILPVQYMFDAGIIRELIIQGNRPTGLSIGDPFANTAYLYMLAGVGANPQAAAFFTYLVAWASVLMGILLASNGGRYWLWFPAFIWHAILVVFTCMHTKEMHSMPALALMLLLAGTRFTWWRVIALGVVIAGYAGYFRMYWLLAGMLTLAFIVSRRRIRRSSLLALAMFASYLLLFVGYHVITGEFLTDVRAHLTAGRDIDLFSDSLFANFFVNGDLYDDIANALFALGRLIMPVGLIGTGKLQHLAFAVWEALNVGVFVVLFARVWRRRETDARTEFAAAWVLAFTLIQAIFEPDYGSFLRHQTALLPAFAMLALNAFWSREGRPFPVRSRAD